MPCVYYVANKIKNGAYLASRSSLIIVWFSLQRTIILLASVLNVSISHIYDIVVKNNIKIVPTFLFVYAFSS